MDPRAPTTSALCHPKLNLLDRGKAAAYRAKREMAKPAASLKRWAASVMMARLLASQPPKSGGKIKIKT